MKTILARVLLVVSAVVALASCSKDAPVEPLRPATQTVELQVSLTFEDGDTKPVASTKFYMLRKSVVGMMEEIGMDKFKLDEGQWQYPGYQKLRAADLTMQEAWRTAHSDFAKLFKSNIVAEVETDMSGKAAVSLAPGTYYVHGMAEMRKNRVYWDNRVTVGVGSVVVPLNAKNGQGKWID